MKKCPRVIDMDGVSGTREKVHDMYKKHIVDDYNNRIIGKGLLPRDNKTHSNLQNSTPKVQDQSPQQIWHGSDRFNHA